VTLVVRNTTVLVVKPETPVGSAKEPARRQPPRRDPVRLDGTGSTHLALELFQSAGRKVPARPIARRTCCYRPARRAVQAMSATRVLPHTPVR
jgi:hypothetical protein